MNNPAMRFKRDDGTVFPDWNSSEIGNVADTCSGGTPSTSVSEYWDGPIQWLTPTEINSKYVHNSKRTITSAGIANSSAKLLPIGSLLLTTRATIGACSINNFDGDVSTNQGFQSLICKSSLFNEYAYYAITRDKFQKELIKHSSGSTFLEISPKNLKKLPIPIPCLEEQQKIASFFSTLDQKIELNERKIEALEKLKKGVMQQIFNQKISFHCDSGQKFEPWHEAKLKLFFAKISSGKSQKSKNGTYPLYGATGVIGKTNDDPYDGEKILVARVGSIGKVNFITESVGISDNTLILSQPNPGLNLKWLFFYFENFELTKLSSGSSQKLITSTQLKELSVYMPCIEEQQKISALFSSLDNKIKLFKHRNLLLHQLKRGLMQQMFV